MGLKQKLSLVVVVFLLILLPIPAGAASYYGANTYTNWYFPEAEDGYDALSVDVKPLKEATADNGVFWAHQFWLKNGNGGYIGLQNNGAKPAGKIAVFSIWEALDSTSPEYAAKFGGEGVGYTARIGYDWQVNRTYKLKIEFDHTDSEGDWWRATVKDIAANSIKEIGQIKVVKTWDKIASNTSTWMESYLPLTNCDDLELSSVIYYTPTVNENINPESHDNSVQSARGDDNIMCAEDSFVVDIEGGVKQSLGSKIVANVSTDSTAVNTQDNPDQTEPDNNEPIIVGQTEQINRDNVAQTQDGTNDQFISLTDINLPEVNDSKVKISSQILIPAFIGLLVIAAGGYLLFARKKNPKAKIALEKIFKNKARLSKETNADVLENKYFDHKPGEVVEPEPPNDKKI